MKSLITMYDNIFLNKDRINSLIDKFKQDNEDEKLKVLNKLVSGYMRYRGNFFIDVIPTSMEIILPERIDPKILNTVIDELSVEDKSSDITIVCTSGTTYISLC